MIARHCIPSSILRDEVSIILAGCGGTGSRILPGLAQIDFALKALGHPGFSVMVFDGDSVSEANVGRQLFYPPDIGRNKADVMVNRVNACYGLSWRSVPMMLNQKSIDTIFSGRSTSLDSLANYTHTAYRPETSFSSDFVITAVDQVPARRDILKIVHHKYALDVGNTRNSCQVVLGTSKHMGYAYDGNGNLLYPDSVDFLPGIFDLYPTIDKAEKKAYQGPSCSVADALKKQDLFINSWAAMTVNELLWEILQHPFITRHGAFLNLETSSMRPLPVDPDMWARMAAGTGNEAKYKKAAAVIKRRITIAAKKEKDKVEAHLKEAA